MLLGNKEKTIRLHAENFLIGNITFDYGIDEDERLALSTSSFELSKVILEWLKEEETGNKSETHKLATANVYRQIMGWRIRGRIKGQLIDIDLESRIEELVKEKSKLEEEIKRNEQDILKAINTLKDQDRTIAGLEAQIFYLKKQ